MKKIYETPEMEVFNFETPDEIMDSGCTTQCPTNTSCSLECPLKNENSCIMHDPNCPSECFLDGACLSDVNVSLP